MKEIFCCLLLFIGASVAQAEIFKCQLESGKVVYQAASCQPAVAQKIVNIKKTDPHKATETEAALKAWEADFAVGEATKIKANKERQAHLYTKRSQRNEPSPYRQQVQLNYRNHPHVVKKILHGPAK